MATVTRYVRKTGNDANTGTDPDTDAVLTIARAYALCSSADSDIIDIGEGTWVEDIYLNRNDGNGTEVDDITWRGAGMYKTTINGNGKHPDETAAGSTPLTFQDLKIELAADNYYDFRTTADLTMNDVWVDFNGKGGSSYFFLFEGTQDVYFNRCIFNDAVPTSNYMFGGITGTTVCRMNRCIFYNCTAVGISYWFRTDDNAEVISKNCIFNDLDGYTQGGQSSWTSTYDCYYGASSTLMSDKTGNIIADPKFVDPANEDFSLQDDSPCIGAGQP